MRLKEKDTSCVLVDVREGDEVSAGCIEGAHWIPRGQLEVQIGTLISDRDTPIAIYCATSTRSVLATASLTTMGYTNVVSVRGGVEAWLQAGQSLAHSKRLNSEQRSRYSRQTALPQLGEAGQLKLLESRVLCVGAGGLGSPTALYLAAAGVGTLGIVDHDITDISNLQRQILHNEHSVGTPKVDSAKKTLSRLNNDISILTYNTRLDASDATELFKGYDVIVDGSDNFPTRYLINDASFFLGIPNVHGSIYHFDGQCTVFNHENGPCYRCVFPEPPAEGLAPNCADAGVLGAMCGVVGTLQAVEVIKILLKSGISLSGRLMSIDGMTMEMRTLKIQRNPQCPLCSEHAQITTLRAEPLHCSGTR